MERSDMPECKRAVVLSTLLGKKLLMNDILTFQYPYTKGSAL